jgi:hypothetical protein
MVADKVWVVYGSTGEYSDFTEWWVCACLTEERAKEITDELNTWCREKGFSSTSAGYDSPKPDLDPNFRAYYTGTGYSYGEVEVR